MPVKKSKTGAVAKRVTDNYKAGATTPSSRTYYNQYGDKGNTRKIVDGKVVRPKKK